MNRYAAMIKENEGVQTTIRFAALMEDEDEEPATWNRQAAKGHAAVADNEQKVTNDNWTKEEQIKVAKHLATKKKIRPAVAKAIVHLMNEKKEMKHGGGPSMQDGKRSGDVAQGYTAQTMTVEEEEMHHGGDPTMMRKSNTITRGDAWNSIKQQNWVQQTIADRDKKWCPPNMEKKWSPADKIW